MGFQIASMILESKGITIDKYYVPPFQLKKGEIVVLCLFSGQHFYETAQYLKNIFTGKIVQENIAIYRKLTFVEHFVEPWFRQLFYPVTIGEYLKKNANPKSPFATKIYENQSITPSKKVKSLTGYSQKLLSLYATLSNTNDIIFDLVGQGPKEAAIIYEIVKEIVNNGGSAIVLDNFQDLKDDCTRYVEL
jgi:hypothetical protein